MADASDQSMDSSQRLLFVGDAADAIALRFMEACRTGGWTVEHAPDVYRAMARLANAQAGGWARVVVDTRTLHSSEQAFLDLAPRYFRGVEVSSLSSFVHAAPEPDALDEPEPTVARPAARSADPAESADQQDSDDPGDENILAGIDPDFGYFGFDSTEDDEAGALLFPFVEWPSEPGNGDGEPDDQPARENPQIEAADAGPPDDDADPSDADPRLSLHEAVRRRMQLARAAENPSAAQPVQRTPPPHLATPAATDPSELPVDSRRIVTREELDALLAPGATPAPPEES